MKRYVWFLILTILFFYACSNSASESKIPTIDEEKMARITADLHIVEAHLQNSPSKQRDSIRSMMYDQLYKIHDIDSTTLYENQTIYYTNPKEIEVIYNRVLEILNEKEKNMDL